MKAIVQGLATEYRDDGQGPVWLYLHGWKDDLHTFDPLISALNEHRAVRLDLPGFGATDMPALSWSVSDYAKFVQAFLDKLDIKPDILIGHSMGGRIAIRGIADGIFAPRKLVLIASAGAAERNALRAAALLVLAKIVKTITAIPPLDQMQEPLRRLVYGPTRSDYENSGALRETFLKQISENLVEASKKIAMPTLLLWGSEDSQTPVAEGMRLHESIKGSALHITEGAGHFVHREHPEKVADLIKKFCV